MQRFNFELFLAEDTYPPQIQEDEFLDLVEQLVFEVFEGDVTPAVLGGVPVLLCSIESSSAGDAFDRVASVVTRLGLHPTQMLMKMGDHDRLIC